MSCSSGNVEAASVPQPSARLLQSVGCVQQMRGIGDGVAADMLRMPMVKSYTADMQLSPAHVNPVEIADHIEYKPESSSRHTEAREPDSM
jgi:hypothetical protein